MQQAKLELLRQRRDQLAALVGNVPAAESNNLHGLLQNIDQLLARASKSKSVPREPTKPGSQADGSYLLVAIPKTDRAELRVSLKVWKSRRTVDLRLYYKPKGSDELVPSRKGVALDAGKLDALLSGLALASQFLPRKVEP